MSHFLYPVGSFADFGLLANSFLMRCLAWKNAGATTLAP
jgi:hypothetical protein